VHDVGLEEPPAKARPAVGTSPAQDLHASKGSILQLSRCVTALQEVRWVQEGNAHASDSGPGLEWNHARICTRHRRGQEAAHARSLQAKKQRTEIFFPSSFPLILTCLTILLASRSHIMRKSVTPSISRSIIGNRPETLGSAGLNRALCASCSTRDDSLHKKMHTCQPTWACRWHLEASARNFCAHACKRASETRKARAGNLMDRSSEVKSMR
jgi:hypothetical protein